jgi:hypothetical protein
LHATATDDTCYGYASGSSDSACNTQAFVNRVNTAGLCGASDWRLPNREELRSIVKMDYMPKGDGIRHVDTDYFPNTQASYKVDCMASGVLAADYEAYCSGFSTSNSEDTRTRGRGFGYGTTDSEIVTPSASWAIFFDDEEVDHAITKDELRYVRLVRGEQPDPNSSTRYSNNGDGTVTDSITGLTWKRCAEGYTFSDGGTTADMTDDSCTLTGTETFTWSDALAQADSIWRVPNIKELASLARHTDPAGTGIDIVAFPDTPPFYTWSSTYNTGRFNNVWIITFTNGGDRFEDASALRRVRLVRD